MQKQKQRSLLRFVLLAIFLTSAALSLSPWLRVVNAQFIDRIVRPCSAGAVLRASVIVNPGSNGNIDVTPCTGGSLTVNGVAVTPGVPAPITATYITQTANATLTSEQALASLATGLMFVTTTTGVVTSLGPDLPFANLTPATAASKLLGRGSAAGAGDYEEITLGTGLSMSGATLNATGGTVTSVSVVSNEGVSGTVANATTVPAITLNLGIINPDGIDMVGTAGQAHVYFPAQASVNTTTSAGFAFTSDATSRIVISPFGALASTFDFSAIATSTKTFTWPNENGTVCTTGSVCAGYQAPITFGTGVQTALGVNIGSAGAPVLFDGAGGTPSALTLTSATGLPLSTGVTGDLPFANLTQGSALSVLGVTGNATADFASIAAGTDNQVLRRSGTTLAFGAVNLASSNAITGDIPDANLSANVPLLNAANTFSEAPQTVSKNQNATTAFVVSNTDVTNGASRGVIDAVGGAITTRMVSVALDAGYAGTTSAHSFKLLAGGNIGFSLATTGAITLTTGLTNSTGTPGSLCYNTATFEMTKNNALTCTVSAREYKSGITALRSGLAIVLQMKPSQFAYKDNLSRSRWGFMADELQAVNSRLGDGYDAKEHAQSIDIPGILAVNTKAIQDLHAIVVAQQKEIDKLKRQGR